MGAFGCCLSVLCQIVGQPNLGSPGIGRASAWKGWNELRIGHAMLGKPKRGLDPSSYSAYGQWPIFDWARTGVNPNAHDDFHYLILGYLLGYMYMQPLNEASVLHIVCMDFLFHFPHVRS